MSAKKSAHPPRSLGINGETELTQILDLLQGLLAVVDGDRRVVFANQAFLDFTKRKDLGEVCGLKPGDIFECAHAACAEKGCGTSENCRLCGAYQAIEETRSTGMPSTREFRITGGESARALANEFRARTAPFQASGNDYILICLQDISAEKRKTALERIFFHDILNTASSIKVYLDLLRPGVTEDGSRRLLARLDSIAKTLLEEIQSQKILVSAENKTLTVQRSLISSRELVEDIVHQFDERDISQGKKIAVAAFSEDFSLVSDDSLLRRVLTNAMKNGLEASGEGATVTIGFGKQESTAKFWVHNPGAIEDSIKDRIFHRYFSTKGEDRGLGTYSMKLLTQDYLRGAVGFESSAESGTTFTITLPVRP
jgi:signal transduction histidine kinase